MKKALYIFLAIIVVYAILGIFFPIIPFYAKQGFHGKNGEFCGFVYHPECDQIVLRFFKWDDVLYLSGLSN